MIFSQKDCEAIIENNFFNIQRSRIFILRWFYFFVLLGAQNQNRKIIINQISPSHMFYILVCYRIDGSDIFFGKIMISDKRLIHRRAVGNTPGGQMLVNIIT